MRIFLKICALFFQGSSNITKDLDHSVRIVFKFAPIIGDAGFGKFGRSSFSDDGVDVDRRFGGNFGRRGKLTALLRHM